MATRPAEGFAGSALCAAIDALERDLPRLSLGQAGGRVDALRRLAIAEGPRPAGALAAGMARALARDGQTVLLPAWLHGLREAAGCADDDGEAAHVLMAAISVRLAG